MGAVDCDPCCQIGKFFGDEAAWRVAVIEVLCAQLAAAQLTGQFTANLAQVAGTYDLATATGGDVLVTATNTYVAVAGAGFTSVAIQSNNGTPDVILTAGEGALANVTPAGKNLKQTTTSFLLPSGKKLQYTIVGTGTLGTLFVTVVYRPVSGGTLV